MKPAFTILLALCLWVVGCGQGPAVVTVEDAHPSAPSEPTAKQPTPQPKTVDPAEAKTALEKAPISKLKVFAEMGVPRVQFLLGVKYEFGKGVPEDAKEAVKWYQKAAEQGLATAQYNLGVAYRDGLGVEQDFKEAVKWFQKVADQGLAQAQYNLGAMYANGKGVEEDNVTAYAWLNIADTNGQALAKKYKDIIAKRMTSDQITKAEALVKEMIKSNPKLLNK